jgi:transposase
MLAHPQRPMMLRDGARPRILAWREPVDMRRSFDGLVGLVRGAMGEDPLSGALFVFVNRRGNHLKLVYWDRTGFALFAKRLERGRFVIPGRDRSQPLSLEQFLLVLDGILLGGRVRV